VDNLSGVNSAGVLFRCNARAMSDGSFDMMVYAAVVYELLRQNDEKTSRLLAATWGRFLNCRETARNDTFFTCKELQDHMKYRAFGQDRVPTRLYGRACGDRSEQD
jgi:hypothetical protein